MLIADGVATQTSAQLTSHLLCEQCEQRLGLLDRSAADAAYTRSGECPIISQLGAERRRSEDEVSFADAVDVETEQLAAFGVSVVWRLHAGSRHVELGPYAEDARSFLVGEAPFPRAFRVLLGVYFDPARPESPGDPMATMIAILASDRAERARRHRFLLCGLQFEVVVGQHFSPYFDELCLHHATTKQVAVLIPSANTLRSIGKTRASARPVGRLARLARR